MGMTIKNRVYALTDENENYTLAGDLIVDAEGTPTFNGRVESKSNPGSSFTAYYHGGGSNLQVSTAGCRDCVLGAYDFLDEAVQKALKESMEDFKPKDDTIQDARPPVEGTEENVSDPNVTDVEAGNDTESTEETSPADGETAETTTES